MNYSNLTKNKCPKCNKELDYVSDKDMMMCTISCGFMIGVQKMAEICADRTGRKISTTHYSEHSNVTEMNRNNQDFLNNFDKDLSPEEDLQDAQSLL